MCEMFCQIVQKKQEEKRIEEEQAAKARYWKIPACCDDDGDYDSAITSILSTEEPVNSLSMGDEHLDTILAMESDELIKSCVENLVPNPSESEGKNGCDCQPPQYTINHPIINVQNDILTSQTTIMKQMTQLISMCELVCQIFPKKQEEKRIKEQQAANARYWKIPACCDDDDNYNSAVTPVLSTEEPDNSLSMGGENLDTILATESDEVIKSSVEDLVQIPSEFEGIPDTMCDVHLVNNPTPLEAKDHFEIALNSNDDISSSDNGSL
nr:hypothetical protein [Tanacetum cinerariifolium]